ncbi:MAG: hypothetical protein ACP5VC_18550, partial [Bryobacteraceae bacterium]
GAGARGDRVADGELAGGREEDAAVALCGPAGEASASGLLAERAARRAVAAGFSGCARAAEPTKYWLSNLPAETPLKNQVELAKHRWIVERDYLELKQELGPGHFEGRSWRGFHHHEMQCGLWVSGSREEPFFPPWRVPVSSISPCRHSRKNTGRGGARKLGQRVEPLSIASLRQRLAKAIARQLPCCPFCGAKRL